MAFSECDPTSFLVKQNAIFHCSNSGMKVTVEDMKSVQLIAYLDTFIFQVSIQCAMRSNTSSSD